MKKAFDMNNPVWQFIGKLADALVLHVLWVICCIPIVTIGPSTTALYSTLMRDARDEGSQYYRNFFKDFKANMKDGIALGLIFLVLGAALVFGLYFYSLNRGLGTMYQILWAVDIGMLILYMMTLQYVFALQARFVNTVKTTIINAFFMSIRHIGWTFVMIVIFALVYFVAFYVGFLPILLLGYGLVVYLDSYILNHIFKPYVDLAEGRTGEEADPDVWVIPEDGENPEEALPENAEDGTPVKEIAEETAEAAAEEAGEDLTEREEPEGEE